MLQSLHLRGVTLGGKSSLEAIGLLISLTKLEWYGKHLSNDALADLERLTKLQVLHLCPWQACPHPGYDLHRFVAVVKLPELTKVVLGPFAGIRKVDVTDEFVTLINSTRHSRSWPPLALDFDQHGF
jgi:hypothetical protein